MRFTDIFIRRPVLASVVSLMMLVLGLRAGGVLPHSWHVPAKTEYYATVTSPKRYHERISEAGIDFAVVYPTMGIALLQLLDDEQRVAFAHDRADHCIQSGAVTAAGQHADAHHNLPTTTSISGRSVATGSCRCSILRRERGRRTDGAPPTPRGPAMDDQASPEPDPGSAAHDAAAAPVPTPTSLRADRRTLTRKGRS